MSEPTEFRKIYALMYRTSDYGYEERLTRPAGQVFRAGDGQGEFEPVTQPIPEGWVCDLFSRPHDPKVWSFPRDSVIDYPDEDDSPYIGSLRQPGECR